MAIMVLIISANEVQWNTVAFLARLFTFISSVAFENASQFDLRFPRGIGTLITGITSYLIILLFNTCI